MHKQDGLKRGRSYDLARGVGTHLEEASVHSVMSQRAHRSQEMCVGSTPFGNVKLAELRTFE